MMQRDDTAGGYIESANICRLFPSLHREGKADIARDHHSTATRQVLVPFNIIYR